MATEWHPGGGGGGGRAGGSQPCPEAHAQRFQLPSRPRPCVKAQVTTAYPQVTPGRQVRRPEKISPRRWLQLVTSPRPGPPALPQGPLGADTGGQGGEASRETPAGRGTDDRALSSPRPGPARPPPHVPHSAITCYLPWAAAGRPWPEEATASACRGGRPDTQAALLPTPHPEKAGAWTMDAP